MSPGLSRSLISRITTTRSRRRKYFMIVLGFTDGHPDMRWYSTAEICTILSRFTAIHVVGDSMMRHLAQSFNIFLREDLPTGARNTWAPGNPPGLDCTCHTLFDSHECEKGGFVAIGTEGIYAHDSRSMKCPQKNTAVVDFLPSAQDPPSEHELMDLKRKVKTDGRREAFIFGQGGWDDFEVAPAQRWVSAFEGVLAEAVPGFERPLPMPPAAKQEGKVDAANGGLQLRRAAPNKGSKTGDLTHTRPKDLPHRLWVSPNAQGLHKNPFFILGQNNIKLEGFERDMRAWLNQRGFDVLGIFNLTVQSESYDGTHATMESNLVKAMMVLNWLDFAGREDASM